MLVTILLWILIFFESAAFGQALFSRFIDPITGTRITKQLSTEKVLLGFVALITINSYIAIFFPLSQSTSILILIVSLALFLSNRPTISLSKPKPITILLYATILLFTLETATRRAINPDTNLYHAQAIHWIEQYPAIFGVGNIHGRLAFNSVWFIANAFYSFDFLFGQSLHLVSGAFFLFFTIILITTTAAAKKDSRQQAITALLLLFAVFQYLAADISSPGSDTPAVLSIWLLLFFLFKFKDHKNGINLHGILITALAAFAITIKLSAVMIILFPLIILLNALIQKQFKAAAIYAAILAFILTPYLVRNIIQSGYLIYPFPSIDIFNFAWKVPIDRVIEERNAILVWGRLPRSGLQETLAMPFWVWIPKWFAGLTTGRKLITVLALSGPFFLLLNYRVFKTNRRDRLVHGVFIVGSVFWLLTTPDIRFGYGFLIPTIILNFLPLLCWVDERANLRKLDLIQIGRLVLLIYILMTFARSFEGRTFASRLLLPRDYDNVKTESCTLGSIQMRCSVEYNACSYHDFPCVPQPKNWVRSFSDDILDGFYGDK